MKAESQFLVPQVQTRNKTLTSPLLHHHIHLQQYQVLPDALHRLGPPGPVRLNAAHHPPMLRFHVRIRRLSYHSLKHRLEELAITLMLIYRGTPDSADGEVREKSPPGAGAPLRRLGLDKELGSSGGIRHHLRGRPSGAISHGVVVEAV